MSASREKKTRQELSASGYVDPRKAREEAEKAKDRRTTRLYTAVIAAFVLLGVVLYASGHIQENRKAAEREAIGATAAVRINDTEYTVSDVAYYFYGIYNSLSSYATSYGLDTSVDLREQQFTDDQTWYDYISGLAMENLQAAVSLAAAAQEAGFDGGEEVSASVESSLSSLDYYASYSGMTRAQYLQAAFGEYMTEDAFTACVHREALASAYQQSYSDALSFTDEDVQAAYDADPKNYQSADVEYILFDTTPESDASDEDKAAAQEANRAKAAEALERFVQGESFESIAEALEGSYTHLANTANGSSDLQSWAFDDARVSGDVTSIDYSTTGCYAVLFHTRSRNDYHTVSVRHILVDDADEAQTVLDEYLAGEQTEDAFAALAAEHSTDSNASSGGLYTDIYKGYMVAPFEDWSFDPARQSGDTGIVETEYGYHVMYFVEANAEPYWMAAAHSQLKSDALNTWYDSLTADAAVEQLDGMQYVG